MENVQMYTHNIRTLLHKSICQKQEVNSCNYNLLITATAIRPTNALAKGPFPTFLMMKSPLRVSYPSVVALGGEVRIPLTLVPSQIYCLVATVIHLYSTHIDWFRVRADD